jgi:hypothetical protein
MFRPFNTKQPSDIANYKTMLSEFNERFKAILVHLQSETFVLAKQQFGAVNEEYHLTLPYINCILSTLSTVYQLLESLKVNVLESLKAENEKQINSPLEETNPKFIGLYSILKKTHEELLQSIDASIRDVHNLFQIFQDISMQLAALPYAYAKLTSDPTFQAVLTQAVSQQFKLSLDDASKFIQDSRLYDRLNTNHSQKTLNQFRFFKDEIVTTCLLFLEEEKLTPAQKLLSTSFSQHEMIQACVQDIAAQSNTP